MKTKSLWLDSVAAVVVAGASYSAFCFVKMAGLINLLTGCVLGYAALRIAYEMTFNRRSVPTIASAPAVRRQVAQLIANDYAARGGAYRVVDLGSGRGELARAIAKAVPQAQVTGVELALVPHWRARLWQTLFGPANLNFQRANFFTYDCTNASAVVLFLGKLTVPAGDKLLRELAPGSLVISNDFELGENWLTNGITLETITLRTPFKTVLYIYRR